MMALTWRPNDGLPMSPVRGDEQVPLGWVSLSY